MHACLSVCLSVCLLTRLNEYPRNSDTVPDCSDRNAPMDATLKTCFFISTSVHNALVAFWLHNLSYFPYLLDYLQLRFDVVAPKINCSPTAAYVGDRNVAVACTVRAKPAVTAMFWIIDANGTSVSNDSVDHSVDHSVRRSNDRVVDVNGTSVSEGDLIADHWTLESVCRDV